MAAMLPHLTIADAFILMLYLGMVLAIGAYALMRQRATTDVYFFAARKTGWVTLGASLFSSQFLLAAFLPLNGSFHSTVLGVVALAALVLIGTAAVRVIASRKGDDENRSAAADAAGALFGRSSFYGASAVPVVVLGIVRLAATMLFCSYAFESFTEWNPGSYSIIIILVVGLFTIVGGFRAVASIQAFLMTGVFASVMMLASIGSVVRVEPGLWPIAPLCGLVVLVAWSWSGDHYFLQHTTSARSSADVTKGFIFTAVLNMCCIAAMLFIRTDASMQTDAEFSTGAQGIIIAGILSLVMASLAGIFSSTAAFFTLNVLQPRLSDPSERKLVLVGRLVTTAIVVAAIISVVVVRALGAQGSGVLQTAIAAIAAPLAAVYWCNKFNRTRGLSEASWPAAPALAAGVIRLLIEAAASQGVVLEGWSEWFVSIHFLALGAALFAATVAIFAARTLPALFVRYGTGNE
jgi:solute:Na+ symporter, SSS family